jgi:hypothetical protein
MKKESVPAPVDLFTIDLAQTGGGAVLKMSWGDASYSVDIKPAQ